MSEEQWQRAQALFPVGASVRGMVVGVEAYGVWVEIPGCPVPALFEVVEFGRGRGSLDMEQYPQVGEAVVAVVIGHNARNKQIRLGTRASGHA